MDNEHNQPPDLSKDTNAPSSSDQPRDNGYSPYSSDARFSDDRSNEVGPLKQSKLGIASFIIALVAVVLLVVAFALATANSAEFVDFVAEVEATGGTIATPEQLEAIGGEIIGTLVLIIVCMFGSMGIALVGAILAFIGIFAKNRRKTFAIIGLVLNGLLILGAIGLVIAGLAMGAASGGIS
ncbi:hypothetical protein [Paenibacillus harenae]|uniref:DUF4064 domain-containing protein n=1 Tax=Paenibacillus harenae TaxID=306543 RepID=A0ABT9U470_PAEHA|nr:hypothetical protein [Paenibacillus harenae]MDQ0058892.1 hypothetical protein [Paenibacillus harenae]MDQ0114437.1 hypothetical protein [Paenibacillus harenae]